MVDEFPENLIGQEVRIIVSDVSKEGLSSAKTYFGKLISVNQGFVTIAFNDGKQETFGSVIKISRRD